MIAHKKKLGAVFIALSVSSPAWAHMSKMNRCTDISIVFQFATSQRNEGQSPKMTYNYMKKHMNPGNFNKLFDSDKKRRHFLKKVVNQVYFNKQLQRTTSQQVAHAVRNQCMGWGRAKWHRLKTH